MNELTLLIRHGGDKRLLVELLDANRQQLATDSHKEDASNADFDSIRQLIARQKDITKDIPNAGRRLGDWLLPGKVRTEWLKQTKDKPVRTILDIAPNLADVPWELAYVKERLFLN